MQNWVVSALAALLVGLAAPAAAQAPKDLGVSVGVEAPQIAGTTQDGKPATFADLKGQKGLVIAFVRSADWCPFCKQQLKDLNSIAGDLDTRGFKLAALSYDSVETLAKFAKSARISYTLLSDPRSAVIDAFGIRNMDVAGSKRMDGIPHPAIYVISADGVILDKLYEESYRKRPPTDVVIKAVDAALAKLPKS
jgi:peroxiredoxin